MEGKEKTHMEAAWDDFKKPGTIRKFLVGIFFLGVAWNNLNNRIDDNYEKDLRQDADILVLEGDNKQFGLDIIEMKTKLTNIEALLVDMKQNFMTRE